MCSAIPWRIQYNNLEDDITNISSILKHGLPIIDRNSFDTPISVEKSEWQVITDIEKSNLHTFNDFFNYMLDNGVFFAPSAYEAGFISDSHTQKDFEKVYKLFDKFIKLTT